MFFLLNPYRHAGRGAVLLLANFNGSSGSTTFTDSSGYARTLTAEANAQLVEDPKKYGSANLYLDGIGDAVTVSGTDFNTGTDDFTLRLWARPSNVAGDLEQHIIQTRTTTGNGWVLLRGQGSNVWTFTSDDGITALTSVDVIPNGAYAHIEVGRSGNTFYFFVDGVLKSTATSSQSFTASNMVIGRRFQADGSGGRYANVYLDDIEFRSGACLHTTDFTPPSGELTL